MTLSDSQYAALAEWIYARDNLDQALQLAEIGAGVVVEEQDLSLGSNDLGLTRSGDKYYSSRGFVGTVFRQGTGTEATYIVVLRGSDWGSAEWTQMLASVESGESPDGIAGSAGPTKTIDGKDWNQNYHLGRGNYYAASQADDAIALAKAAIAAAGGEEHKDQVVVVGQSLGGGLAGLVTAELGIKGYAIAPAPFDWHVDILARFEAGFFLNIPREDVELAYSDANAFDGKYKELR